MFSRRVASHYLRRSLLAPSRALTPARQFPKYARLNSSTANPLAPEKPGKPIPEAWVPPILSYEQVKSKTEQPSPVRFLLALSVLLALSFVTRQDSYLIDVREPEEVIQGSIPSSVNIPLSVLPSSLHLKTDEFEKKFGFAKPRRDQEIVFYCRSGVRAATAGDIAKKNGYEKLVSHGIRAS